VSNLEPILRRIVQRCAELRLDYFITGSVASSYFGESRLTNDVDIVIELPARHAAEFCEAFPAPDFYADPESARRASQSGGQFNIIHVTEGVKADLIMFDDTPHNRARLERAQRVTLYGDLEVRMSAPEDVILKKLEFFREGGSDKHLRDIASMLRTRVVPLDMSYLEAWTTRLGLTQEWRAVLDRVAQAERGEH